jgi:acetylglutamate kinase
VTIEDLYQEAIDDPEVLILWRDTDKETMTLVLRILREVRKQLVARA